MANTVIFKNNQSGKIKLGVNYNMGLVEREDLELVPSGPTLVRCGNFLIMLPPPPPGVQDLSNLQGLTNILIIKDVCVEWSEGVRSKVTGPDKCHR